MNMYVCIEYKIIYYHIEQVCCSHQFECPDVFSLWLLPLFGTRKIIKH